MSLRAQAAADLATILSDVDGGFAHSITVTDPNGRVAALTGNSTDIFQAIDPDTGQLVAGRTASVAIRRKAFTDAGLGQPVGIADPNRTPWVVEFDDVDGASYRFKVAETLPDREIGAVVCILKAIK